jgi:hypothetical protein
MAIFMREGNGTITRRFHDNDPCLPTMDSKFIFASTLIGNEALVVIPNQKTLSQFIDMIRVTYGPFMTSADSYGIREVTIIGNKFLNLRLAGSDDGRDRYVSVYNLTLPQSVAVYRSLMGTILPCVTNPYKTTSELGEYLDRIIESGDLIC